MGFFFSHLQLKLATPLDVKSADRLAAQVAEGRSWTRVENMEEA